LFSDPQPALLRALVFGAFFFQIVHTTRINYLLHIKQAWAFIPQPLSALLFLTYCLLWLLNDSFWARQETEASNQKSGVRRQNRNGTEPA
jgi:hypothetical protein